MFACMSVFLSHMSVHVSGSLCFSETNLKVRQAIPETAELGDNENNLGEFDGSSALINSILGSQFLTHKLVLHAGEVKCETPNNKLDKFDGRLEWKNNKYSLNNNNLLLRVSCNGSS